MEEKRQLEYFLWGLHYENWQNSINTINYVFIQQYIQDTGNSESCYVIPDL